MNLINSNYLNELKNIYDQALSHEDVVGINIGTRPDCVEEEKLEVICNIDIVKNVLKKECLMKQSFFFIPKRFYVIIKIHQSWA